MCINDEYMSKLAPIYKDILAAFPTTMPNRKAGHGLHYNSLDSTLKEQQRAHTYGEILEACHKMADSKIVEIRNRHFVYPTEIGERLISKITGRPVPSSGVPSIDPPT